MAQPLAWASNSPVKFLLGCESHGSRSWRTTRNQGDIVITPTQERKMVRMARSTLLPADVISARVGCDVEEVHSRLGAKAIRRGVGTVWILKAKSSDIAVRRSAASAPSCPSDILRRLARDGSSRVRSAVASNDSCPSDALRRLARDRSMWVRSAVASNQSCPLGVLRLLVRDRFALVRLRVAERKDCPGDFWLKLARDRSPEVRCWVAHNPF